MSGWISVERVADIVLLVMLGEACLLTWSYRRSRSALKPAAIGRLLAPGAFLVLSLRLAPALPTTWPAMLLCLVAAFAAHVIDLHYRRCEAERSTRAPPGLRKA